MDPMKLFVTDSEKTFQYDDGLPPLPLPPLHQTLQKYLDSVKPHLTRSEYENTANIVEQFEHGVGADLYKKLEDKAKNSKNWLEKWWDRVAYLDNRAPTPTVNFGGPGPYRYHSLPAREGGQMDSAGIVTYYTLLYWKLLRQERLRLERDSKGNVFTMHQHRRQFSSCRIPGVKTDSMKYYFKSETEGKSPIHLVVLCKGRFFSFDAFDQNEELLSPPELEQQFKCVRDKCHSEPEGPGLGILTGANRVSWSEIRSRLLALHPKNHEALETIQSSILCTSLEDCSPVDGTDIVRELLAGNSVNRWFDKSFNIQFFKNGLVGCNCDHTPMEAIVLVSSTYFVDLNIMKCKGKWQGSQEIRRLSEPTEIVFHTDWVINRAVKLAQAEYLQFANNLDCSLLQFKKFGKDFIRQHKIHPDAFVQLALQYSYFRKYGRPAPTYETATTRKYWHARTETVRSCTVEAIEWSKAMLDDTTNRKRKVELFLRAINKHVKLMVSAASGQGCDRLLLGLGCQAEEDGLPMPEIFLDQAYVKSGGGGNFKLSTSFVGYTTVGGCVAPMCTEGYGTFYHIEATKLSSIVTAWKSDRDNSASAFNHRLHSTLAEMGSLLEQCVDTTARL